jgi:hypothetical protein
MEKFEMGKTKEKDKESNQSLSRGLGRDTIDWLLAIDAV